MSEQQRCKCGERLRTVTSRAVGNEQLRYMRCPKCGASKRVFVRAEHIWRRSR